MDATMEIPIGVRQAARELSLNPSTVTRYLQSFPELRRGDASRPLVLISELRRHRAGNVNDTMSGNHAGRLLDDDPPDEEFEDEAASERRSPNGVHGADSAGPGYRQARTARETIQARLGQIQLEERLARLVSRSEVEDAASEAGMMLRDQLGRRNRELSARLARMTDAAEIAAALDASDQEMLGLIADAFDRSVAAPGSA